VLYTPFYFVIKSGYSQLVQLFLDHGANPAGNDVRMALGNPIRDFFRQVPTLKQIASSRMSEQMDTASTPN